eukprot:1666065-Pleurochrysis_carterae.AAC.1
MTALRASLCFGRGCSERRTRGGRRPRSLGSATSWPIRKRLPFVDPDEEGGVEYNTETLTLLAEYIRRRGSRQASRAGSTLRADTIATYVAAVRLLRSREARRDVAPGAPEGILALAYKRMRMEDPPVGTRKLSRAFRAAHFRALASTVGWSGTAQRRLEWAAALLAHNLLLPAGEIGHPQERKFDGTRDLTWASFQWMKATAASGGFEWVLVH